MGEVILNRSDKSAIYTLTTRGEEVIERSITHCSQDEVMNDRNLMGLAVDHKYAAREQDKVLVLDVVPHWKAFILKLIGVQTGEHERKRLFSRETEQLRV